MPIYVSAMIFYHTTLSAPLGCALTQIESDVTSLRTVYMCKIRGRLTSLYWPCECVRKLPKCIPHRRAASSVDGTLVWEAGKRLTWRGKWRGRERGAWIKSNFLCSREPTVSSPGLWATVHRDYTYLKNIEENHTIRRIKMDLLTVPLLSSYYHLFPDLKTKTSLTTRFLCSGRVESA